MTGARLSLSRVEVRWRGRIVLRIDDLKIPPGAFVGIVGTNGAGKTTLLKVCCGLIRPRRGRVRFDGVDLAGLSGWGRSNLRKRIGYIPQAAEFNAELPFTLREVVAMGRTSIKPMLARLGSDDYDIVDRWIEKLGLGERRNQTFRSLSGGEQQKALVARAMVQEPELLMLDEPCSNLDFNWRYQITEIVSELHRRGGMTVLMVSHETSLLPAGCERMVLLHEGRLLADDRVEAVLMSRAFERAYRCRVATMNLAGRMYTVNKGRSEDSP
jgi:iron complex transport system ATP-binding protein